MKKVLIATGNPGKKKEMLECFSLLKSQFNFCSLNDCEPLEDIEENGETFEENALIKARHYAYASGLPTLAEDSGIRVPSLPEYFGVKTKRTFKAKDDMDWLTQFLEVINEKEDKSATFFSAMAYVDPINKTETVFLGSVEGQFVDFPQSPLEKGVPLSAVFIPEGQDLVFSAMNKSQKNKVSHRGKSAVQMATFLKAL